MSGSYACSPTFGPRLSASDEPYRGTINDAGMHPPERVNKPAPTRHASAGALAHLYPLCCGAALTSTPALARSAISGPDGARRMR